MGRENRIQAIFQILTEMTPSSLNAGAMQLLLNSPSLPEKPLLLLALPGTPENALRENLKRLGIDLLTYAWQENSAVFPDLDDFLPRMKS
jgi:hypothetical protein